MGVRSTNRAFLGVSPPGALIPLAPPDSLERGTIVPKLLTEHDVEREYGVRVSTLRSWRYRGRGCPYLKLGASVRYRVEDIERWLSKCCRTSTSAMEPPADEAR